eukprot:355571-Chlamydomonas_euryale.AAC.1
MIPSHDLFLPSARGQLLGRAPHERPLGPLPHRPRRGDGRRRQQQAVRHADRRQVGGVQQQVGRLLRGHARQHAALRDHRYGLHRHRGDHCRQQVARHRAQQRRVAKERRKDEGHVQHAAHRVLREQAQGRDVAALHTQRGGVLP